MKKNQTTTSYAIIIPGDFININHSYLKYNNFLYTI